MSSKYSVDDILNEVRRKKALSAEQREAAAVVPEIEKEEKPSEAVVIEEPAKVSEPEKVIEEPVKVYEPEIVSEEPVKVYESEKVAKEEPIKEEPTVDEATRYIDFKVEPEKEEEISEIPQKGTLTNTGLLKLRTEEFSALGESMDKAEAWETFVKITEMRDEGQKEDKNKNFREEIDDYIEKDDERSIKYDIRSLRTKVRLRMWVCLVFGLGLTFLSFLAAYSKETGFLSEFFESTFYIPSLLILTILPCLFCLSTIFGGLWSLFKFKPDSDSPVGLAAVSVIIFSIVLALNPNIYAAGGYFPYNAVVVLGLAFNAWGKLFVLKRAMCNFGFLTSDGEKQALRPIETENLAAKLVRPFSIDGEASVVISRKVGFLKDFLKYSYAEDSADRSVKITAIITLFASIVAGVVSFVFTKDIFRAVNVFVLMCVMCSPFGHIMSTNIPLLKASKKALKHGGMISGFVSVEDFSYTDAIVIDSDELFPKGTIHLHGIKTFEGQRIDEAIIDAASVVVASGTTLKEVFSDIIDDKKELLKPVDTLVYEDSMGVSGWVDSKRVLIGNRTLMENHNIIVPSKDYEEKYKGEGTDTIYLANSGTLTAMFVVSYNSNSETVEALKRLKKASIKVLVRTTDPNITRKKLSDIFDVSEDLFSIVPSALHKDCKEEKASEKFAPASAAHTGRFPAFAAILTASVRAKKAMSAAGFFNAAGLIISYILVMLLSVMGEEAGAANEIVVLIYQLALCFFTAVIPSMKRY